MREIPDKHRPYSRAEQVADTTVHLVGVVGALLAVPVMITLAAVWRDERAFVVAVAIYGTSLVAMFVFSAGYNITHLRNPTGRLREVLRRFDHAAIYVKIAGTYTPFAVIAGGPAGRWLLIGVWSGALLGSVTKLLAPDAWERTSLALYLALGWAFVFGAAQISAAITHATMILIAIGGALYTIGVVFHLWRQLPFQNAIWHALVLVATFVFYSAVLVEISFGT